MADKDVQIQGGGKRNELSVVAEDKNWRSYVANELACADRWHNDWGFLAGGALDGKYKHSLTDLQRARSQPRAPSRTRLMSCKAS